MKIFPELDAITALHTINELMVCFLIIRQVMVSQYMPLYGLQSLLELLEKWFPLQGERAHSLNFFKLQYQSKLIPN